MHTLFSPNILLPYPGQQPHDPSEVEPEPAVAAAVTPVLQRTSTFSSFWNGISPDEITQNLQNLQYGEADQSPNATSQYLTGRSVKDGGPNLLLMGLKRSGKSSIANVLFRKTTPVDTLYIESTNKPQKSEMRSFLTTEIHELPATYTPLQAPITPELHFLLPTIGALIWVIDIQDEYIVSLTSLLHTAVFLFSNYPHINLEVFIHKTEGLSDEYKYDTFRDVRQRVQDELSDLNFGDRGVAFHPTSVYDHSIFEATSKVVQKLVPQLPTLEALLNRLCSTCRIEKAYLFDSATRLYIATDAAPTSLRLYEACSDYVDMIEDMKEIYGWDGAAGSGSEIDCEDGAVGESLVTFEKTGNGYMYAREIDRNLSLVCIMGADSGIDRRAMIGHNISLLQEALLQVFNV